MHSAPNKLPHSEETERAVLAAILVDPVKHLPVIAARISAGDFYFDRHQRIYASMLRLDEAGSGIDLRTVQGDLEVQDELDLIGGLSYLFGLDVDLPDISHVDIYADTVRERSLRRQLIESSMASYQECTSGGMVAADAIALAEDRIQNIRKGTVTTTFTSIDTVLKEARRPLAEGESLSTGWRGLDAATGVRGFMRTNLVVVAGRPGMGKSVVAANLCRTAAIYGYRTTMYSLEMRSRDLVLRELSAVSGVPLGTLKRDIEALSPTDLSALDAAERKLAGTPLNVEFRPDIKPSQIEAEVRSMDARPDLVVIDYLQLMTSDLKPDRSGRNDLLIADMTRRLKKMAGKLNCVVVLLSQLSRAVERRESKRPVMSDLRDSGAIEQDADIVIFPWRPSYYPELRDKANGDASRLRDRFIVAKQRDGETGEVEMEFQGECVRWLEMDTDNFGEQQGNLLK